MLSTLVAAVAAEEEEGEGEEEEAGMDTRPCAVFVGVRPSLGEMILSFSLRESDMRSTMLFDAWWYKFGRGAVLEPGVAGMGVNMGMGTMRGCGRTPPARSGGAAPRVFPVAFARKSLGRGVRSGSPLSGGLDVK